MSGLKSRKDAKLSQERLAERINSTQSFVSKVERAQRRIDMAEFVLIARAIGVDPTALIRAVFDDGDMEEVDAERYKNLRKHASFEDDVRKLNKRITDMIEQSPLSRKEKSAERNLADAFFGAVLTRLKDQF